MRDIKGQMLMERRKEKGGGNMKGSSEVFLNVALVTSHRLLLRDCCTFDSRNS